MNNTQSLQEGTNNSNLLRKALQGNALFSGLSGLASFFAAHWLAQFTGIHEPLVFVVLGVILILFAVDLAWIASRESIDQRLVWVVILLDVAWVVGSAAILMTDLLPLTVSGRWAIALLAEVVAVFALLQYIGLRRLS